MASQPAREVELWAIAGLANKEQLYEVLLLFQSIGWQAAFLKKEHDVRVCCGGKQLARAVAG